MTVPLRRPVLARLDGAAGGARRSIPHQKRQAYCASRGYHLAEALGRVEEGRERRMRSRLPSPLIKLDVPVPGIQLSDWFHLAAFGGGPR